MTENICSTKQSVAAGPHSEAAHARLSLAAVCLAALCMPLAFTGPAVALQAIGREFAGTPQQLAWITNAFMLAFGSSLLAAGTLADAQGRRRWFLRGVALYAVASLALCGVRGMVGFDLWRAVQGVGAAAMLASGGAALAQAFDGPARMRAFSLLGTAFGVGLAFGPLLAGSLVALAGWRALFAVLALLSIGAGLIGGAGLRESRNPQAASLDRAGALCFSAALALLTWAVLRAPDHGWASVEVLAPLFASALLLALFVRVERRAAHPMLDLRLFRHMRFTGVQLLAIAPACSFVVLLVLLPLRWIGVEGRDAARVGLWLMALSAPMLVVPLLAGWLTRWLSAATLSGAGLLVCAAGLAWLARTQAGGPVAMLLPLAVIGCGIGLPWGLMDGLAVSVVPRERAGMAAGIFNTTRVAGEGIAVALAGSLLAGLVQHRLALRLPGADAGVLAQAAHRAAAGDGALAMAALQPLSRALSPDAGGAAAAAALLQAACASAFATLLWVLAAVTAMAALAVFLALSRAGRRGTA
jgi:MFS family permease